MARRLRIQFPGAIYHLMSRGDRKQPIFLDDQDRFRLLSRLGECCDKAQWRIHAYCWMPNHFHLVVETPMANLVEGMRWLLGVYTGDFNRRHHLVGHLFAGRYKACLIDPSEPGYLRRACDYVHLNPARGGLLSKEMRLTSYEWSSLRHWSEGGPAAPGWLRFDRLLGEHGRAADTEENRAEIAGELECIREAEDLESLAIPIRKAWFLGSDNARQGVLTWVTASRGPNHSGPELPEANRRQREALIEDCLQQLGMEESDLHLSPKGHPSKVVIASRLRRETTAPLRWIADRLTMGSANYVAKLLGTGKGRASEFRVGRVPRGTSGIHNQTGNDTELSAQRSPQQPS